ncbi:DNA helicase [Georgenia muralis]
MTPPALFSRGGQARRHAARAAQDRNDGRRGGAVATASPDEPAVVPDGPAPGSAFSREGRTPRRSVARPFRPVRPRDVDPERAALVARAAATWRESLVRLGGASTLADITLLGDAVIDLTAAHPSGIAQLYAGRTTRLNNLVREGGAQLAARRAARTVRARADELAQRYGVAPTYLAIGVASWTVLPDPVAPDLTDTGSLVLEVSADPGTAHADHAATARSSAGTSDQAAPGEGTVTTDGAMLADDATATDGASLADDTAAADGAALVDDTAPTDGAVTTDAAVPDADAAATDEAGTLAGAEQPNRAAPTEAPVAPPTRTTEDTAEDAARTRVRTVHAPVLLRAVRLEAHPGESDFDIDLESAIEVNPVLVRALRAAGVDADVTAVGRSAYTDQGFTPRLALARLGELGRENLPGFELSERIVVGPFVHPGQALVDDLDAMAPHLPAATVVAALAGDADARAELTVELPRRVPVDRDPATERGAGDLDVDQAHAVDAVASGTHVFLDAPPGADVPGTVAAILADAAASGRTAMYVPGSRRTGRALLQRISELGLGELVLDLSTDSRWRTSAAASLRAGLDAHEVEVDDDANAALRAELVDVRNRLGRYVAGLHARHEDWDASGYDALQALAELTAARPGPRTRVRLDARTLRSLVDGGLAAAHEELARASALGAFTLRPSDTPWYGARLSDAPSASTALERTQRLGELTLPAVTAQVDRVVRETGIERATTLTQWEEQLGMLDGVAEALDVFLPQIFERSAADMVVATATRRWRKDRGLSMKWSVRRRLRKQAKDLLRPGRPVADLNAELVRVQEQREIWRRYDPAGGWPRLPDGLAEIKTTAAQAHADLAALQDVVGAGAGREDLFTLELPALTDRMRELGLDAPALRLLPERTALLGSLRSRGLGALVDDLTERRVPTSLVGPELDLAWWSSVLEQILRTDPALAGHDGPALTALAERFRELDEAQVASLAGPVRRAVAANVRTTVREHRDEAARLYHALGADRGANLRETLAVHPRLTGVVRPVWLVAPMLVAQLAPEEPSVDLLVLDGVQNLPVEQAVALLARARQVVLVGDSRRGGDGLVGALAPLLPAVTLPTGRAERDEGIAAFLSAHGYGDVIRSVPAPPSASRMRLDLVEGFGMPAPGSDAVESVQSEVDRVVDLVVEHALTTPEQSLAVVALNARHADRVREAVRAAVADSHAVAGFFAADRPEPFTVLEVDGAAGLRRDVVVLSVGFGKTPHGRVLHRFGPVSGPDGLACLVDALDAVRHQLVIVSCIGPGEIDRSRVSQAGPKLLADLLDQAATGALPGETPTAAPGEKPDQLLVDLAERLWRLGLTVVPRYGLPGGVRIPLAIGHPELPGELVVAVLTDDAEYVAEESLRRRDRHWVQRLTARGWRVRTAFSTAVFMDPQAEAEAILAEVLAVVEERRAAVEAALAAATPARSALPHTYAVADAHRNGAGTDGGADSGGAPASGDGAEPHDGVALRGGTPGDDEAAGDPETAPQAGASGRVAGASGSPTDGTVADTLPGTDPSRAAARRGPVRERGPRPPVVAGLPLAAYSDDQLDDLLAWVVSDGAERDDAELVEELRGALALTRRGAQVDAVLGHVVRRRP